MSDKILTAEDVDYLEEMMNIGAGNAASALEQILKVKSDMHMPEIHVVPPQKTFSVIGDPLEPVACVKMNMVGDIQGDLFFIISQEMKTLFSESAVYASHIKRKNGEPSDTSVIVEVANILAGVYLTAIHDFCKLNIYHTTPFIAYDMVQAILDESIARRGVNAKAIIVVANRFSTNMAENQLVRTFLIFIPSADSEKVLLDSIRGARQLCGR